MTAGRALIHYLTDVMGVVKEVGDLSEIESKFNKTVRTSCSAPITIVTYGGRRLQSAN